MEQSSREMNLYNEDGERLYLNLEELDRFILSAKRAPAPQRRFALMLVYTGMRLSEARELRFRSMQLGPRVLSVRCLKRRKHVMREIPMPHELVAEFETVHGPDPDALIWQEFGRPVNRIKTYRWIKAIMAEAELNGPKACPKGLRHAFGVRGTLKDIPQHMIQLWMGHASMRTTAIYTTVLGKEQLELSDRMWASR